jgi:uncharacterized RDD family membrane protein YckC
VEQEFEQAIARLDDRCRVEESIWFAKFSRRYFVWESLLFLLNAGVALLSIFDSNPLGLLSVAAGVVLWHDACRSLSNYRKYKHFLINENPRSTL